MALYDTSLMEEILASLCLESDLCFKLFTSPELEPALDPGDLSVLGTLCRTICLWSI